MSFTRGTSDKWRREKSNHIDSKISTIFFTFRKHTATLVSSFIFTYFFCVYFLFYYYFFFGVSDIEEKYEKKKRAHSKSFLCISLHSTSESALDAPVNTTIQYGHKRERSEKNIRIPRFFIIIFQHLFILFYFVICTIQLNIFFIYCTQRRYMLWCKYCDCVKYDKFVFVVVLC